MHRDKQTIKCDSDNIVKSFSNEWHSVFDSNTYTMINKTNLTSKNELIKIWNKFTEIIYRCSPSYNWIITIAWFNSNIEAVKLDNLIWNKRQLNSIEILKIYECNRTNSIKLLIHISRTLFWIHYTYECGFVLHRVIIKSHSFFFVYSIDNNKKDNKKIS